MKTKFTQKQIEEQIETLVKNDVYCTAGDVVEVYTAAGKIDIDDTIPRDLCPFCCGVKWTDNTDKEHTEDYYCPECKNYFDYPYSQEVFEWHFVSEFLAEYLEKVGALVVRTDWLAPIWGRTETGQTIKIDTDIERSAVAILEAVEKIKEEYKK